MKISALLILLCCVGDAALFTICQDGWFGPRCRYKCHCLNNEICAKNTGTCQIGCARGWFGPACQYMDLAATNSSGNIYLRILTDNNDTTCYDARSPGIVYLALDTAYSFTWLRVHVQDPKLLDKITVRFNDGIGALTLNCKNQVKVVVSERTLDIHCHLNVTISQVILEGNGVRALCSVHISGGRNMALRGNAQQSSNYREGLNTFKADKAVDGNTNGDFSQGLSCSHTDSYPNPSSWNLTFQKPVLVTRYVLYNRIDDGCWYPCDYRLKGFTLMSFGKNRSVVLNYTDAQAIARSLYTVIQDPCLEPVSYLVISPNRTQLSLTLCEVEVYGDSICAMGKYGRDCEHTCNCAQNESCFVSTGGCPSGCPAGFWGESCDTAHSNDTCPNGVCPNGCAAGFRNDYCNETCEPGKYGSSCKYSCSRQCLLPENEDVQSPCSHTDGKCLLGCVSGYEGLTCSHLKSDYSELTRGIGIGIGVSVCLIVIATVVSALIVFLRRKMKSQGQVSKSNSDLPKATSSAPGEVLASSKRKDPEGYENFAMNDYHAIKEEYSSVM